MARILILIGGHLSTAPRPLKEADLLSRLGHEVTVAGRWYDPSLADQDQELNQGRTWTFRVVLDQRPQRRWLYHLTRVRVAIAQQLFRRLGIPSPTLLNPAASAQLRLAQQLKPDLTIAHHEAGLWVIRQLHQQGLATGVDLEDWFSEDLPVEARRNRPIRWLKSLEQAALQTATYRLCTSAAMAQSLAEAYSVDPPTVIVNSFPLETEQPPTPTGPLRLTWFSQTIGPGRGLENLLLSLNTLAQKDWHLTLIGELPSRYQAWWELQLTEMLRQRVSLCGWLPPTLLKQTLSQQDLGLCLETSDPRSRDLTITNKLFQYWSCSLPVLATPTRGQREALAQAPSAGWLVTDGRPQSLITTLAELMQQPHLVRQRRSAARAAALASMAQLERNLQQALGAADIQSVALPGRPIGPEVIPGTNR